MAGLERLQNKTREESKTEIKVKHILIHNKEPFEEIMSKYRILQVTSVKNNKRIYIVI